MKEMTEEEAREALNNLYTGGVPYLTHEAYNRANIQLDLLFSLITRHFQMEKVLKEILNFAYHPDGCQCEDRFKIAQQALTGKGEE